MTLLKDIEVAIDNGSLPNIFNSDDIKKAGIVDKNNNLSNYATKNKGENNQKKLIAQDINGTQYYFYPSLYTVYGNT